MLVYIFRHAHKNSSPWDNPPLSSLGLEQATRLVEEVGSDKILHKPTLLFCSPKLRTVQSFQPLSQTLSLELRVHEGLNERHSHESAAVFKQRVNGFLHEMNRVEWRTESVFLCTHLDWIEEALIQIPSSDDLLRLNHWSPIGYAGFRIDDGLWKLLHSETRRS